MKPGGGLNVFPAGLDSTPTNPDPRPGPPPEGLPWSAWPKAESHPSCCTHQTGTPVNILPAGLGSMPTSPEKRPGPPPEVLPWSKCPARKASGLR